eukprot:CAMPEP_0170469030 /NCGR_PEP_ID=MMETSP0123-20130129/11992_1 /TAXON_ID=182087 /ORGANISM="Favella ehrenbergii, Strain Fehren 1" /LENGTH=120 /DNA_ID=CAMNT_0010735755 /DNA_START=264 /DNA_END=626 /DNA_ORIENTATION=-
MGVAVPEMLVTEGDEDIKDGQELGKIEQNSRPDHEMKEEDFLLETAGKSHSLVEFMQLENQIKMSTMKSIEGAQSAFVGDSFQVDALADSVGTLKGSNFDQIINCRIILMKAKTGTKEDD